MCHDTKVEVWLAGIGIPNPKKPNMKRTLLNPSEFLFRCLWAIPLLTATQLSHAALTHQYSFDDSPASTNAVDSVGGADGALYPGATYPGDGTVVLDGASGFVYLPDDIVSNYTSITFEIWTTPTVNPIWARLFDFGTNEGGKGTGGAGGTGGNGVSWTYLCLNDGGGSYRGDLNPGGFVTAPQPTPGQKHHLVFSIDAAAQTGSLFDNGKLVGFAKNFTATPQAVGHTFNDYIGRSQFIDAYYNGSIDEFRIYDNPVSPSQAEADYEAGPNSTSGNAGALLSIQFANSASVVAGGKFSPVLTASYASLTNAVDVSVLPEVTYSSDDTNVLSFGTDGLFHAGNPGTTTIHATYETQSTALVVTVATEPAVLVHRYSFDGAPESTVITDSAGAADGTLMNQSPSAALNGSGQLNLDGNGSSGWVSLPSGMMGTLTNATFQMWMVNNDAFSDWAELWAFGTNNGSQGVTYLTVVPNNPATHTLRLDYHGPVNTILDASGPVPVNEPTCVTVTYNYSAQIASLYMNGRKVGSGTMTLPLYTIPDSNNYIGQSQWYGSGDPYLNATLDEFRIYSGVKSDLQIAIDAVTGPDTIITNPGPLLSLTVMASTTDVDVHGVGVPIQVLANFENVSGVDVTTLSQTTVASGDTFVGTIVNGNFMPRNAGSSTLTASYNGISGSLVVNVIDNNPWPTLLHRYDFNEISGTTLNDLVGTIDGTINGPVTLDGSMMTTPAGNPAPDAAGLPTASSGWVSFPAGQGLISSLPNAASIECWVIWQGGAVWQEMFDFGVANTPGISLGGGTYLMVSPRDGANNQLRMEWFPGGLVLTGPSLEPGILSQVVITHDQDRQLDKLYLNGQLIGSGSNPLLWSSLPDTDNWLARDQWRDAMFNGSYADLRIWNGALTSGQVAGLYAAGPNVLAAPPLQIAPGNSQVTLKWPANATAFTLQSTSDLSSGSWTPVSSTPTVANGLNTLVMPVQSTPTYFRLKQ